MNKLILMLCATLFVTGLVTACSSTGDQPDYLSAQVAAHNETADEGDKIICKYVKDTGTFIKKKRCRSVSQIKEEREAAQQTMGDIMSGGTNSASSGQN